MPVTRRRSIALGMAAAFGATTALLRAETSKKYDVIVIGAGFAGLHAARLLAADGLKVLVLESDQRVGGRSHTAYEFDSRIELGASQVGRMYARILDTARTLGIEMAPGAHINAPYSFVIGDQLIPAKDWSVSRLNPLQGAERSVPPHALGAYYIEQRNPFQSLDEVHAATAANFDLSVAEWLARQSASTAAIHLINQTLGAPGLENQSVLRMFQEATRMRVENRARAAEAAQTQPGKDAYERAALNSYHVVGGSSKLTDAMAAGSTSASSSRWSGSSSGAGASSRTGGGCCATCRSSGSCASWRGCSTGAPGGCRGLYGGHSTRSVGRSRAG